MVLCVIERRKVIVALETAKPKGRRDYGTIPGIPVY